MSDWVGIGDSIMLGVRDGVGLTDTFAYRLASVTGKTLVNMAVGGAVVGTFPGRASFQPQIDAALARDPLPACIAYMPGFNDIFVGTALSTFRSIIDTQIAQIVSAGVPLTVLTPWVYRTSTWIAVSRSYVQVIRDVANDHNVPCIDVFAFVGQTYLCEEPATGYWLSDGQHPSIAGNTIIYNWCRSKPNLSAPISN